MQTGLADNKVVVFRVGREEYAVPIAAVQEVGPWTQPTPVPEAPPIVEGVIDLRGAIIPIIDLGKLFRTERLKASADAKILIIEMGGQQAGFVVDDVTEVQAIDPQKIAPPSPVLRTSRSPAGSVVSGIINMGESRLVVLVDPVRILASADAAAL